MDIVCNAKRIAIRSLEVEDASLFAEWWNNGELMKDVGFKKGMSIAAETLREEFAKEVADTDAFRLRRRYVITDRFTNHPIGELAYGNLNMEEGCCGIGIKICEIGLHGKGLGRESLTTFMDFLIKKFTLKKIEIDTLKDNERAYNLYKKLGFYETKILENFWTDPEGNLHDLIFMEMTAEDFYKMHGKQEGSN